MTEKRNCMPCQCAEKVKGFLTKEHSATERIAIAGGILLTGVLIGSIAVAIKKK